MVMVSYCCVLLLLPWSHAALQSPHVLLDEEGDRSVLIHILDSERRAVTLELELYKRKAELLKALLAQYEGDEEVQGNAVSDAATVTTSQSAPQTRRAAQFQENRQRAHRQQQQHSATQRFSDWFDPQGSFYPPILTTSPSLDKADDPKAQELRLDLLSFRPNANPNSKKSHNGQRGGRKVVTNHLDTLASSPLLQFITAFNMEHGRVDLYSPTTKELVWQHELGSSPITDYFFASERLSYLATVSASGDVRLYQLRVLHNRRLLSGNHRILSKFDQAMCLKSSLQQLQNQKTVMGTPLSLPWRSSATSTVTTLPAANHPHIDFDLVFHTTSSSTTNNSVRTEKIAVVTFYSHSYVITANSAGELAFFHGENGSFISSLATDWFANEGSDASRITQFHVLTTGIVAAAVGNRIHFVNPQDQTLVNGGATCDGAAMGETITSVDSDPWRYSTVYAGTSRGRVLVFRLLNFDRLRRSSGRQQPPPAVKKLDDNGDLEHDDESEPACVLVDQLLPKPKLPPVFISGAQVQARHRTGVRAIPGYVVMTTNSEVVLFQASYEGLPTYVIAYSTRSLERQVSQNASDYGNFDEVVALSAARDPNAHPAALAVHILEYFGNDTSRSRLRVDVYESLLPQPTSSLDLGWLRVPIMLLCAVAVMYWQQQGNGNENNPSQIDLGMFGGGSGVGSGAGTSAPYRSKNEDFDIARLAKMAQVTRNPQRHHCV